VRASNAASRKNGAVVLSENLRASVEIFLWARLAFYRQFD